MVSPYSIWSALAMVLPGARGRTRQQLADRLGIDDGRTRLYFRDGRRGRLEPVTASAG